MTSFALDSFLIFKNFQWAYIRQAVEQRNSFQAPLEYFLNDLKLYCPIDSQYFLSVPLFVFCWLCYLFQYFLKTYTFCAAQLVDLWYYAGSNHLIIL